MKSLVCILAVLSAMTVLVNALTEEDLEKFDNFDMSKVMSNKRLRTAYVNCMLDKGSCTPDAADFKKAIPELVQTHCQQCSPKFKSTLRKSINVFRKEYPSDWEELQKHYDPEGKNRDSLEAFLKDE